LDSLAVDALHMMAFVDTEPAQQIGWNQRALALALGSPERAAQRWEGSLRHNLGLALRAQGELDAAIAQFRLSGEAYQRFDRVRQARIADWMVASVLRTQGLLDEAIAIQRRLEALWEADGQPDPFVFQELEALYRAKGDAALTERYATRRAALGASVR
jgi:tetratricopeptide (TPR) repeat protein